MTKPRSHSFVIVTGLPLVFLLCLGFPATLCRAEDVKEADATKEVAEGIAGVDVVDEASGGCRNRCVDFTVMPTPGVGFAHGMDDDFIPGEEVGVEGDEIVVAIARV